MMGQARAMIEEHAGRQCLLNSVVWLVPSDLDLNAAESQIED